MKGHQPCGVFRAGGALWLGHHRADAARHLWRPVCAEGFETVYENGDVTIFQSNAVTEKNAHEVLVVGGGGREHAIIRKLKGGEGCAAALLRAGQRGHCGRRRVRAIKATRTCRPWWNGRCRTPWIMWWWRRTTPRHGGCAGGMDKAAAYQASKGVLKV